MNLQRVMLIVQTVLARCVEMKLKELVILHAAKTRSVPAGVGGGELNGVPIVLYQKFSGGSIRVFEADIGSGNIGVDVDRGLIFSHSTGGICFVEAVPEDRAGISSVGPVSRPSCAFVDTGRSHRGERCREDEGFD